MVNFTFLPLSDPRLTPDLEAKFLRVAQLVNWSLTDSTGTYTGLVVVGEKPHPQGFQSTADFTFDIPAEGIATAKVQELSRIVLTEFQQRAVVQAKNPPRE